MRVGTVSEILRFPVKSMGGESLDAVQLGAQGLPGDRSWAVRDEVNGGIRGARKIGRLMELSARFPTPPAATGSSPAEITFPDGSKAATGDIDVSDRISDAVDHKVSLWPLVQADDLDHYRRGAPTHEDRDTELRALFARTPEEPLPDLSIFPPELKEFESAPGTYFDAFPLLLLTASSLATMQERAPQSLFDVRRFRPNFLISETSADDPFPEQAWRARRLRIGEAIVEVTVECPRCVMTTRGFAELPRDPSVMRSLVTETGGILGVYASVEQPGRVRAGDSVELLG
jgi:uncharacterized protein YcbX